jgi:hypothetical protein
MSDIKVNLLWECYLYVYWIYRHATTQSTIYDGYYFGSLFRTSTDRALFRIKKNYSLSVKMRRDLDPLTKFDKTC